MHATSARMTPDHPLASPTIATMSATTAKPANGQSYVTRTPRAHTAEAVYLQCVCHSTETNLYKGIVNNQNKSVQHQSFQ